MDVDRLAEVRADHGRAFDVPAGPAAPRGRLPPDDSFRARFPQYEVRWIALIGCNLDPSTCEHRLPIAAAECSVIRVGRHMEQHVTLRFISVVQTYEPLDHRDHRADFLR